MVCRGAQTVFPPKSTVNLVEIYIYSRQARGLDVRISRIVTIERTILGTELESTSANFDIKVNSTRHT